MKKSKISSIEISSDNLNEYEDKINFLLKKSGSGFREQDLLHVYIRVSTRNQEDNYSLDNQKRLGMELGSKMSFPLTIIWNEKGKSSNSEFINNRPVLNQLYNRIKSGKVKNLFIQDMSRLSRNENVSNLLKWELRKNDVRLFEKSGKYNFSSPNDRLMFGVLSLFSEHENSIRRMRSVLGKLSKVKNGEWCGGMIGFGWKVKDGKILEDRKESKWVKKMFEWYDEKKTLKYIQSELFKNGVKTRRGNDIWNRGSIVSLLKKTSYIGYTDYVFNDVNGNEYKHQYIFPKIIETDLWKRVQNKIKNSRSLDKMINGGVRDNETLLTTYLVCNGCGKLMGRKKRKNKNGNEMSNYVCRTVERYWNNPKKHPKCKSNKSMNTDKTDNLIWDSILEVWKNSYLIKEEFKKEIIDKVISDRNGMDINGSIRKQENSRSYILRNIDKYNGLISDLEDEYYEGNVIKEQYEKLKSKLQENISTNNQKLHEISLVIDELVDDKKWIDWLNIFDEEYHELSELTELKKRKDFLNKFLDKIEVVWDKETKLHTFKIIFKKPIINDIRYKNKNGKFIIRKGENSYTIPPTKIDRKEYKWSDENYIHNQNRKRVSSQITLSNYSTVTDLSERVKCETPTKHLQFTIQISGTNLNYYPEYNSHQQFLFDKCTELKKKGLGYRKISNWFRERNIKTKMGSEMKGNYVYSILKKGNVKEKRDNRTFKPIIKDLGIKVG